MIYIWNNRINHFVHKKTKKALSTPNFQPALNCYSVIVDVYEQCNLSPCYLHSDSTVYLSAKVGRMTDLTATVLLLKILLSLPTDSQQ